MNNNAEDIIKRIDDDFFGIETTNSIVIRAGKKYIAFSKSFVYLGKLSRENVIHMIYRDALKYISIIDIYCWSILSDIYSNELDIESIKEKNKKLREKASEAFMKN